jgi:hypothetical protein
MPSREFTFNLVFRHPGRVGEEEWEVIEPRFAEYWKSAAVPLCSRTYEHNGCTARVEIDWAPYGRRIIRDHNIMAPVRKGQPDKTDWYAKVSRPLRLEASCVLSGSNKLSSYDWYPTFFLEYFFYEIFAISNLACPGSAEFHGLSIEGKTNSSTTDPHLSAFYFDEWMIESVRGLKPSARLLSPETAAQWFSAVNPRVTQKAENGTQRALFALYHLCKNDGHIDFVMWLFNALESLLSTRVGENFSGLVRRAALVLELSAAETAAMSKRLRKLYDLRSAFVHGGYDVAHPIHSEPIDERLNEHYGNVLQLSKYGFFLLASLLQRMTEKNLTMLVFEEKLAAVGNTL